MTSLLLLACLHLPGGAIAAPPASADTLAIVVNVPAFRLEVRDGDSVRSFPVAVGTSRYRTPLGRFRMQEVIWNPWWIPPESEWARDERVHPPGPTNPMGRVKMRITTFVYIHGTPLVQSLGSAASHACIRMANEDAIALALIVHARAVPRAARAVLDSALADSTRTRGFTVTGMVDVDVRYDLAEVRRDTLWLYPDVYGLRDGTARSTATRALSRAGVDTSRLDEAVLTRSVRDGRRRVTGIAVDSLLADRPARRTAHRASAR